MTNQPPDVDFWMVQRDLNQVPNVPFPAGYWIRNYREGDLATWVRVQQAAEPFFVPTEEHFSRSMPGDTAYLSQRVKFLIDPSGSEIGTITAWNGVMLEGQEAGQIHWVAIIRSAQGKGLAKPMLTAACWSLLWRGYTEAWLETNTRRIPAIRLYLRYGFKPYFRNEFEQQAWFAIAPLLLDELYT
jgi:ribosomal protein S18 acetylase RimI-like enzyme